MAFFRQPVKNRESKLTAHYEVQKSIPPCANGRHKARRLFAVALMPWLAPQYAKSSCKQLRILICTLWEITPSF
jgi:hypothetical protein